MSKSLGNSLTIRDALKMYNYEAIKYLMFSKHYSSDMDIFDNDFQLAERHIYYFYNTIKGMQKFIKENKEETTTEILKDEIVNTITQKFIDVMDDDFNTAAAIANLHIIFKYINNIMKNGKKNERKIIANTLEKILNEIKSTYKILGLLQQEPEEFIKEIKEKYLKRLNITETQIEEQINKRADAKNNKDYETADKIRENLEKDGIVLKDNKDGTTWDFKALYNL